MGDTIREYLVSLGFSVNEAQMNKFKEALGKTAKGAASLGLEVIGAGAAITAMVEQVSKHFSDLYYMSQRTGSTVSSLSAIGFAAKQVGLSTEEAQGAVESFASAMRSNPGMGALFQGLTYTKATGDSEKDLRTLVKSLSSRFNDTIALQFAAQFGQSERAYLNMKNNMAEIEKGEQRHIQRLKEAGIETDVNTDKWTKLNRIFNDTLEDVKVMGQRIATDWRGPLEIALLGTQKLILEFHNLNKSTEGWLGTLTGAFLAFGGVSALLAAITRGKVGLGALRFLGGLTIPGLLLTGVHEMIQKGAEKERERNAQPGAPGAVDAVSWPKGVPLPRARPLGMGNLGLPPVDENAVPLPPVRPVTDVTPLGARESRRHGSITVNQTNNITGSRHDANEIGDKVEGSGRKVGDVIRNLGQRVQ